MELGNISDEDKKKLLRYFESVDKDNDAVICTICRDIFTYRGEISFLRDHLAKRHQMGIVRKVSSDSDHDELDAEEYEEDVKRDSRKRLRSKVWDKFSQVDTVQCIAKCGKCQQHFSYRTSTSNLQKHYQRKHSEDWSEEETETIIEEDDDSEEIMLDRHTSKIWSYFERISNSYSECKLCHKRLSHRTSTSNLKRHLTTIHPQINVEDGSHMFLSTNGQLYEIDTTKEECEEHADKSDVEVNTVYLDDFEEPTSPKQRKIDSKSNRIILKEETRNNNEGKIVNLKQSSDSLDHFGTYIVSLLKQLPKLVANQLQVEFVKQLMAAQTCTNVSDPNAYKMKRGESRVQSTVTDATDTVDEEDIEIHRERLNDMLS